MNLFALVRQSSPNPLQVAVSQLGSKVAANKRRKKDINCYH